MAVVLIVASLRVLVCTEPFIPNGKRHLQDAYFVHDNIANGYVLLQSSNQSLQTKIIEINKILHIYGCAMFIFVLKILDIYKVRITLIARITLVHDNLH